MLALSITSLAIAAAGAGALARSIRITARNARHARGLF